MTVRVFHGDDSDAFRLLIAETLPEEGGIEVVGGAATADEVVTGVADAAPDVVLLDRLSDGDLVERIRSAAPGVRVIMLSGYQPSADPALAERVDGYLVKTATSAEIAAAVRGG